jgi:hypothetical protein
MKHFLAGKVEVLAHGFIDFEAAGGKLVIDNIL